MKGFLHLQAIGDVIGRIEVCLVVREWINWARQLVHAKKLYEEVEGQHTGRQLICQLRWFPVEARPQPQRHQSPRQVLRGGTSLG
jgi:hypothetical protein